MWTGPTKSTSAHSKQRKYGTNRIRDENYSAN